MPENIIYSKVRGVTFEGRQSKIRQYVKPGMKLRAVREPNNPHGDGSTIGLWAGKQQIGYISHDLAVQLAPHMDEGKQLTVKVTSLTGGESGESIGVNIAIDVGKGSSIPTGDRDEDDDAPVSNQNPRAARPLRLALIMLGLLATALVCGVAQNQIVAALCLVPAAWLLWQWKRAGGRLFR